MSQSPIVRNDDDQIDSRLAPLSIIHQEKCLENSATNNLTSNEKYDSSLKNFSIIKRNYDETNTKTRRLQSITNNNNNTHTMIPNNCRTRTPVDSFVQLNLKPSIDITVEDYKKTRGPMSTTKSTSTTNRPSVPQSIDSNQTQTNLIKKHKTSIKNKSHEEASFDYFSNTNEDDGHCSRSSSSSPQTPTATNRFVTSSTNKPDLSMNHAFLQSKPFEHSKLISNHDFDSHGSSIATKSSSENSGSTRNGSASDSDDDHRKKLFLSSKKSCTLSKVKPLNKDGTPTLMLNENSDHRTSQHDRISSLPQQDSYELVQYNNNNNNNGEEPLLASQVPRFKLPATDDLNGINNSNNDVLSYATQMSQPNNFLSSSQQNRNPEHHEQHDTNHSSASRKSANRTKRRKQSQQQEIIRTELIPGHRGDLDVDELVMFIDGNPTLKQKQRHNSAPLRPTDTNSNTNTTSSRRKSRKTVKNLQDSINNNENKTSQIDEDIQSLDFIDDDDETTHSINNIYDEQNSTTNNLTHNDESQSNTADIDSTNDSNTTNGETSLTEWLEPRRSTSPVNDDNESYSLSPTTLNNSNSEIISEPFVTVTHRRRITKERRQDNNSTLVSRSSRLPLNSNMNDKRRFQTLSAENGFTRPTIRNSLSNIKPFIPPTTKEENTNVNSSSSSSSSSQSSQVIPEAQVQSPPPLLSPALAPIVSVQSQTQSFVSNQVLNQSSPRLSSHSSSSSLPSLVKRQSKPPPVVFLNKSIDIELNDVSFGFDVENPTSDKSPTIKTPSPSVPNENEKELLNDSNNLSSSSSTQLNDQSNNSKSSPQRSYSQHQRNNRGLLFYSGSDIRPQHHRNYSSQTPYIDPLLFFQYNQQRFASNYSQQIAYMNLVRPPYLPSQQPYVLIPTTYTAPNQPTTNNIDHDEKNPNGETIKTSESMQEPLLVYATLPTQTPPMCLHPTKKSYYDIEQLHQSSMPTMYPSQYFYQNQTPHIIPSHPAYFQPITSPSLLVDAKSQHDNTDDEEDNDYEKSTRLYHQARQQSSSHIMSNALQLVYSQEKRNAHTDHFNLDQLTAYLAMKWTDTISHYEQGDDEILLTGE